MTKQKEIEILDATIAKLGPNSYLGPWLADVREELINTMTVDLMPIAIGAARREAEQILALARDEAERTLGAAADTAATIVNAAQEKRDSILNGARRALVRAQELLS